MPSQELVGLISVSAAVILFGSFAAPVKASKTGDGIFFQWVMCSAIFVVGILFNFAVCSSDSNGQCPPFQPFASIGGAIWCLSNILLVPLVDTIGLGLTLFIWGVWESLAGWLPARFGLGLNKEAVNNQALNYGGVALTLMSLVVLTLVQPSVANVTAAEAAGRATAVQPLHKTIEEKEVHDGNASAVEEGEGGEGSLRQRLIPTSAGAAAHLSLNGESSASSSSSVKPEGEGESGAGAAKEASKWTDRLSPTQKRLFGAVGCAVAGSLSGSTFTPAQHVIDATTNWQKAGNPSVPAPFGPNASLKLSDYVLSHFTGIWLTSTLAFTLYWVLKRRKAIWRKVARLFSCKRAGNTSKTVSPIAGAASGSLSAGLPGEGESEGDWQVEIFPDEIPAYALAGLLWGVAMLCWFFGITSLSIVISFPLVTLGPGIVSVLWGILLWKEIEGKRNLLLVLAATLVYCAGAVCIVMSKDTSTSSAGVEN